MPLCQEIIKLLDTYLDGELKDQRREMVKKHIEECKICSKAARCKQQEVEMIRSSFPVPELDPSFKNGVMAALHKKSEEPGHRLFFSALKTITGRYWLVAPVLAGLLIFVAILEVPSASNLSQNNTREANSPTSGKNTPKIAERDARQILKNAGIYLPAETESNQKNSRVLEEPHQRGELKYQLDSISRGNQTPQVAKKMNSGSSIPQPRMLAVGKKQIPFLPSYLPPGFSFENISPLQPGDREQNNSNIQKACEDEDIKINTNSSKTLEESLDELFNGLTPFKLSFLNHEEKRIFLDVVPENEPASENLFEAQSNTEIALTSLPEDGAEGDTGGEKKITWHIQKGAVSFLLSLYGDVSYEELKKIAESVE